MMQRYLHTTLLIPIVIFILILFSSDTFAFQSIPSKLSTIALYRGGKGGQGQGRGRQVEDGIGNGYENILHSLPISLNSIAISSTDQWGLYAAITTSAALSMRLEQKTTIGKALSGPVTAMLITSILTNIGLLPNSGSIYITLLQSFVVKLATPLLLLGADMKKIFRETGILSTAFLFGSLATLLGSTFSFLLFHKGLTSLGKFGDSWKIASALTSKNIGGGLNFMAVSEILNISPSTIATGLAVDNVIGLLYFPLISWIASHYRESESVTTKDDGVVEKEQQIKEQEQVEKKTTMKEDGGSFSDTFTTMSALAIGFIIIALSEKLAILFSIPSLVLSTIMTVMLASTAHNKLKPLISSGETLGKLLLYLFFASVGISSGKIVTVLQSSGTSALFGFDFMMYIIHLVVITLLGRISNIPVPDILVASNANIGNAATASAFAVAMGWKSRVLPALLVGTFGNTIATFTGLFLGNFILKRISGG